MKSILAAVVAFFGLTAFGTPNHTYSIHSPDYERNKMVVMITESGIQYFYFMEDIKCRIDGNQSKSYRLTRRIIINGQRNVKPSQRIQSEYLDRNMEYIPSSYVIAQGDHFASLANSYNVYCQAKADQIRKGSIFGELKVFSTLFLSKEGNKQ